jgi:hypothetical protein
MPLYPGIPHMIKLLKALQKHSTIVILTARSKGAEPLVARNCEAVGIPIRPSDVIATCPADKKAAWRRKYCSDNGFKLLLVTGDRDTDIDGDQDPVALRVYPNVEDDVMCGKAGSYFT